MYFFRDFAVCINYSFKLESLKHIESLSILPINTTYICMRIINIVNFTSRFQKRHSHWASVPLNLRGVLINLTILYYTTLKNTNFPNHSIWHIGWLTAYCEWQNQMTWQASLAVNKCFSSVVCFAFLNSKNDLSLAQLSYEQPTCTVSAVKLEH